MLTAHHTVAFLVLAVTLGGGDPRRDRVLPPAGAARIRHASPRTRPDAHRRAGRARPPAPLGAPPLAAPSALSLRLAGARRRARALALRARRPAQAARLVRGGYPGGRSARRAGVHDRHMRSFFSRMNPTLRGFLIILAIVLLVVVLQLEATLAALLILARIAFLLAIAFVVFLMWRERREEIAVLAAPRADRLLRRRVARGRRPGRRLVRRCERLAGARVRRGARVLRPRHVAHLARPAPLRVAQASVRLRRGRSRRRARRALRESRRAGRRRSAYRAACRPTPRCRGGAASGA